MVAAVVFSTAVIVLIGLLLLIATIVPGVRLYWPRHHDPVSRSDLGVALMGGALIAFAVLVLQLMIQFRTESDARRRENESEHQARLFNLSRASDLAGLDFSDENFSNAYLNRKMLRGANLSEASMEHAYLQGADLLHANLREADLDGARLDRADLRYTDLTGATLVGATLEDVNLDAATLTGADLSKVNLTGGRVRADLSGAILHDAVLVRARLAPADLTGADLQGADVQFADLRGARLNGANLEGVRNLDVARDLSHVEYDRKTRWPRGFRWEEIDPRAACRAETCRLPATSLEVRDELDPALRRMRARLVQATAARSDPCLPGWSVEDRIGVVDAHAPGKRATFTVSTTPLVPRARDLRDLFDMPSGREITGIVVRGARDTYAERFAFVAGDRRRSGVAVYFVAGRNGFRVWGHAPERQFLLFQRDFVKLFRTLGVRGNLFSELRGDKDGCRT